MSHPLLDLNQFAKDHPPRDDGDGPWRTEKRHELFLSPCARVQLSIERTQDIAYGLWRDDELADAGIVAAEADSLAFAEQLNATLGQHLSIRNLQHMVQVFSRELAVAEARRQEAKAKD